MKKITFLFYLSFLPVFVSAQSAEDSVCRANIEKIFKVIDLKVKYEAVVYFYELSEKKNSTIWLIPQEEHYGSYGRSFEQITGYPLDIGEHKNWLNLFLRRYD